MKFSGRGSVRESGNKRDLKRNAGIISVAVLQTDLSFKANMLRANETTGLAQPGER